MTAKLFDRFIHERFPDMAAVLLPQPADPLAALMRLAASAPRRPRDFTWRVRQAQRRARYAGPLCKRLTEHREEALEAQWSEERRDYYCAPY